MYLKSLNILGFKSFAQRTNLDFDRGVTAVVGPNGCGKSNVLDAIRWVLGEQSAKALRGGEMSDVIFNGAESRKPLGMAEVSLTFSDCEEQLGTEWNEVCITRRIYRDGKSEYLLNKAPCRLRDIQNLFMDTGIGRTAYSIMEQGKIDLILSSRPDDRRAVFEEAAGITKYKAQKKEALRKLEYTEANLLRVTDIIKEVKRQIGSLQRQAGKARRYKSIMGDLQTLDCHLTHKQAGEYQHELAGIEVKLQDLTGTIDDLTARAGSMESGLGERREQLKLIDDNIAVLRQQVHELETTAGSARSRIGFNGERTEEFEGLIKRYQSDIAAARERADIQRQQLSDTDSQLAQILETLNGERSQLAAGEQRTNSIKAERQNQQQRLADLSGKQAQLEGELARSQAELAASVNHKSSLATRLSGITRELEQLHSEEQTRSGEVAAAKQQLQAQQNVFNDYTARLDALLAKLATEKSLLAETDRKLLDISREISSKQSRVQVLQQLNEEGEGFERGTQAVLRGLDNPAHYKQRTLGALATMLEVEDEFITPIEAVLGQALQTIVVDNSTTLEQAIRTLGEQQQGRASLVAEDLVDTTSAVQLEALPDGARCWASDRVTAPPSAMPLLRTLLKRVVICDDLQTALQLRRQDHGLTIATMQGEVIDRDGIVTGGSSGKAQISILKRKTEIQQLEQQLAVLSEDQSAIESSRNRHAETLDTLLAEEQQLREKVQQARIDTSTNEQQLSGCERELGECNSRLESLQWEKSNISSSISTEDENAARLEEAISSANRSLEQNSSEQQQITEQLDALVTAEEQATSELNELRVKVATSTQQQENLERQRSPIVTRLDELNDLASQREEDINNYQEKIRNLAEQNRTLSEQAQNADREKGTVVEKIDEQVESRSKLANELSSLESELGEIRNTLSDHHQQRSKLEVKQSRLQMQVESLSENIRRRYQVDLAEFQPDEESLAAAIREQEKRRARNARQAADGESPEATAAQQATENTAPDEAEDDVEETAICWETIAAMVEELTEKVDAMGPVNLEAITEFDELEQRHNFLEEQYNDLTKSKDELHTAIQKINTTTRKLFAETFECVRKNFREMFRELFGGGKADLILVDDDDPLESGIDIIARPPGKQLQSISLLSGGEKTMTAVALLFSIYMVKPSPFCVLDEMDAPLDESNISRFINILDRFVEQSQFVVITHNKRTISRADVLYGVTMEEHGVSKLVGVRLTPKGEARLDGTPHHRVLEGEAEAENSPSIAESFGKSADLPVITD